MTKTIALNAKYRINADERNFILEERYMSQPPVGRALPEGYVHVPQERWKEIGYYPHTAAGLASTLEAAAIKSAIAEGAADIRDFARKLREISADIKAAVSTLLPEVSA